ncbi:MAG: DUF459 domain-containing protein [Pseudomonadota bacterium]
MIPRRMRRFLIATLALFVGVTGIGLDRLPRAFAPVAEYVGTPSALAQARAGKRKSLFSVLFGRNKAKRKAVVKKRKTVRRKKSTRRKTTRRAKKRSSNRKKAVAAAAAPAVVAKSEDARTVLVAGDFYGDDIFEGLEVAFADEPNIVLVDRTNGLSGFVRTDIVDWPATIGPMVEEVKPDYLIFMGGSNDRQQIRENGQRFEKMTPGWEAAYKVRLTSMGEALKAADVPFTWVGLPSVRFKQMSRDFVSMNSWYQAATEIAPKGKFTDIWDGFADAEGVYSRSGPDINGQITLLRRKDGINMTNAGERRLAFYVEGDIRKALEGKLPSGGGGISEFDGLGGLAGGGEETYDPVATGRTVVVSLDDPAADGGEILAGETISFTPETPDATLPLPGATTPSAVKREGRVDDHSWPPAEFAPVAPPRAVAAVEG